MVLNMLKEINDYIKRKYLFNDNIFFTDGENYYIMILSSLSPTLDTYESKSINTFKNEKDIKTWIGTILKK